MSRASSKRGTQSAAEILAGTIAAREPKRNELEFRAWTDRNGKSIRAALIDVDDQFVSLATPQGKTIKVKREGLSEKDREFVRRHGDKESVRVLAPPPDEAYTIEELMKKVADLRGRVVILKFEVASIFTTDESGIYAELSDDAEGYQTVTISATFPVAAAGFLKTASRGAGYAQNQKGLVEQAYHRFIARVEPGTGVKITPLGNTVIEGRFAWQKTE